MIKKLKLIILLFFKNIFHSGKRNLFHSTFYLSSRKIFLKNNEKIDYNHTFTKTNKKVGELVYEC